MRVPETRYQSVSRPRRGRRLITILLVAITASLLAGGVFLVYRLRAPIIPIAETRRTEDALDYWQDQQYERVIEITGEQLAGYPMDGTALALRGFARFYLAVEMVETERKQLLLVGAIQDLRRALLVDQTVLEPEIHYVLGKTYYTMGPFFFDESIGSLTLAADLGIDRLDLLEYLALAHESLGRYEEAIGYYSAAIERNDETIHKLSLADLLIGIERYERADRILEEAIADRSDNTLLQHGYLSYGRSLREQGRFTEALAMYESLLEINASSAEAHYGFGETYLVMEESERARFHWREALRLDPNHIESLQRLREY